MPRDILVQVLKQVSEEMGFYVGGIDDSGVPEMNLKLKYKTMTFEKDHGVWYAKSKRCLGFLACILQDDNHEWVSDDVRYLTAAEHRDIACFLEQLNKGDKT
jgi:hypothetical protein